MGKVQKVVWPRGKNLKPAPKGRTPVQAIPGPRPKSAQDRRRKQDYQLAISKGLYPRGELVELTLQASMQQEMANLLGVRPEMMSTNTTSTTSPDRVALVVGTGMKAAAVAAMMASMGRLMNAAPAPSQEPIEVTEAQYQALQELRLAETPAELMELTRTFGAAVMVVKSDPAPLEGEILPPATETAAISNDMCFLSNPSLDPTLEEMFRKQSDKIRNAQDELMLAAITGCWRLP